MRQWCSDLYGSRPVWWWRYTLLLASVAVVGVGLVLSWRPRPEWASLFEVVLEMVVFYWPVLLGALLLGGVWLAFRAVESVRKEEDALFAEEFYEYQRSARRDFDLDEDQAYER